MSQADRNRIKALEETITELLGRISALESEMARRKPGRPRKTNG